jgi:hypothetical protein
MALTRINNNSLSAVTAAGIPKASGEILQAWTYQFTDTVSNTTTSYLYTATSSYFTPKSASSTLYITVNAGAYVDVDGDGNGYNNALYKCDWTTDETTWNNIGKAQIVPARGGNGNSPCYIRSLTLSSTTPIAFRLGVVKDQGTRQVLLRDDLGGDNRIQILEIAG